MKYSTVVGTSRYLPTVSTDFVYRVEEVSVIPPAATITPPVALPAAEPQHILAMDLQGQVFQVLVNQGQEEEIGKGFL